MDFHIKKVLPKKTEVYDTFWKFTAKRQDIFFARFSGELYPWTDDFALTKYKFTNVYRSSDRVSQYLIKNIIYSDTSDAENTLFRILLFKTFNRISTWEHLERKLGKINYHSFSASNYKKVLDELVFKGVKIYSGAYIMASGKSFFKQRKKHENHLMLIEFMMRNQFANKVTSAKSLEEVFNLLKTYPTIGDFLAYQYAIDINYSEIINFSENDFVQPGPGALSGIQKCFSGISSLSESDVIGYMTDNQEKEFDRLELDFKNLWGRPLHLIDCQNLFCEVDKYSRVVHPNIKSSQNRTRIKQQYKWTNDPINFWFPPKWNINLKNADHVKK